MCGVCHREVRRVSTLTIVNEIKRHSRHGKVVRDIRTIDNVFASSRFNHYTSSPTQISRSGLRSETKHNKTKSYEDCQFIQRTSAYME